MQLRQYFQKMRGVSRGHSTQANYPEIFWSWIGGFLGISAVAWVLDTFVGDSDLTFLLGSFGSSAVLLYGAVRSPFSQPYNLVGGHALSAIVGVACFKWFHAVPGLAEAVSVGTAIALMQVTRTLHPPAGATALIAVIGSDSIHRLGWWYVLMPTTLGALILLAVAVLVNNLSSTRRYPEYWF
ncbi:CBS domain-containing membrane protein [Gammaproteobacteria bacterium]